MTVNAQQATNAIEQIVLAKPGSGEVVETTELAGKNITLGFNLADLSLATQTAEGDLVLSFSNGGTLVLRGFESLSDGTQILLSSGATVTAGELFGTLALAASQNAHPIAAANDAAPQAAGDVIARPQPGQDKVIELQPGQDYTLGFDISEPIFVQDVQGNLVIRFDDGGEIIIPDYSALSKNAQGIDFILSDGSTLSPAQLQQAIAQIVAAKEIEPAAGEVAGPSSDGTANFGSQVDPFNLNPLSAIGPIDPTALQYRAPGLQEQRDPVVNNIPAPVAPVISADNVSVYEDDSVALTIHVEPASATDTTVVTITGIAPGWTVTGPGTFDAASGTWTITLPAGSGVTDIKPVFHPPHDSDVDLTGLVVTGTTVQAGTNAQASASVNTFIDVDAVIDTPVVDAQNASGDEDTAIPLVISTHATDIDGSETITHLTISGVPAGATLNHGTQIAPGVWQLSVADLTGLTITPPLNYSGSFGLTVTTFAKETALNGVEFDLGNNDATAVDNIEVIVKPVADNPDLNVVLDPSTNIVKEDGSIDMNITASVTDGDGSEVLTVITVAGVPASWGLSNLPAGATYDAGTQTLTIPVNNQTFTGKFTLSPPADSDADLSGIVVTATAKDGTSTASATQTVDIITDAVADAPDLTATSPGGDEDTPVDLNIATSVNDTDGSETITHLTISGVPAGATLSAGTDLGGGVWQLTPAQLAGLKLNPPADFSGTINLTVKSFSAESNLSDTEVDFSDNTAMAQVQLPVVIKPVADDPDLNVVLNPSNGIIKEDTSADMTITASVKDGDGSEVIDYITVAGVPATWDVSSLPAGSTYNAATQTWTIPVNSQSFTDTITLKPPADSDADLTGIVVTAVAKDGTSTASMSKTVDIIVDAVIDAPTLAVQNASGDEDTAIPLDIQVTPGGDTLDGSEVLSIITISGVPAGATLNHGVQTAPGVWQLTTADLSGLTITPPHNSSDDFSLTVTVTDTEANLTDTEVDFTDNTATVTQIINVDVKPVADDPDLAVLLAAPDRVVKEDGSIEVKLDAKLVDTDGSEFLTVTIKGIPATWTITDLGGGTYDAATQTWTIVRPNGADFNGGPTLKPPANSDADLNGLIVTATATESENGDTASRSETLDIVVDAVIDAPTLTVQNASGDEDTAIPLDISTAVTDTDGSESITHLTISGVPAGATLNHGTQTAPGVWQLSVADLTGLTITPPHDYSGSFNLSVTTFAEETTLSGAEVDLLDNKTSVTKEISVEVKPVTDDPDLNVVLNPSNGVVKEDGSIDMTITASVTDGDGSEVLTSITVKGIPSTWDVSSLPAGSTYDAATQTWTIPVNSPSFTDTITLKPPHDSDVDLNDIVITATAKEISTGQTASSSKDVDIITDAVADAPNLTATSPGGDEDTPIDLNIATSVNDTDGSETVTHLLIEGVPAGASLSAGINFGGIWVLTPAQLAGLKLNPPADFSGTINLTVKSFSAESNLSDTEVDFTDNTAMAQVQLPVVVNPVTDTPDLTVVLSPNGNIVKEDGSIDMTISASVTDGDGSEVLTSITVKGIPSTWDVSSLPAGSTYDAATQTWTIPVNSPSFADTITLKPPHDSDVDLNDIVVTATAKEISTGQTASASKDVDIIVDAVADTPTLTATSPGGEEDHAIDLNIATAATDTDGSESITLVEISGVPAGAALNHGAQVSPGVWHLGLADLPGLKITPPTGFSGSFTLTVKSTATETALNPLEVDLTDNTATATTTVTVNVTPDDNPILTNPAVQVVDETDLAFGPDVVTGTVPANFFSDAPGTITPTGVGSFFSSDPLTSGGVPVNVTLVGDTYFGKAGAETIFTLKVETDGDYTFTLLGTLDHPKKINPNDAINLNFGVTGTDSDGDTATANIKIKVKDDGPVAHDDHNAYNTSTGGTSGNVITGLNGGPGAADKLSQDDANTVSKVSFGGVTKDVPAGGFTTIDGDHGTLKIFSDGSYTYTLFPGEGDGVKTIEHDFSGGVTFPPLSEGVAYTGTAALGILASDITVAHATTATLTFVSEVSAYSNTMGSYVIDPVTGQITGVSIFAPNSDTIAAGNTVTINIPGGNQLGFFVIADGFDVNGGYAGLDFSTGNLAFINKNTGQPATIHDSAADIKLVFTSAGGVETVLNGPVYHSTTRGDSAGINPDGKVHTVSGAPTAGDTDTLRIGFEDLPSLGDTDYQDFIFDLKINPAVVPDPDCPDDKFTYTLKDGDGDTSAADLYLECAMTPTAEPPTLEVQDARVKEDGAVQLQIQANLTDTDGSEYLTVTVAGIGPGWTVTGSGTYNASAGVWTIVLPPGVNFAGGPILHPPHDSDVDLTGLTVTAVSTEIANGASASASDSANVVVDAVADVPLLSAADAAGNENTPIPVVITTAVTDVDGSESIYGLLIKGVPAGASFSAGSDLGNGTWGFLVSQLPGLTFNPPSGFDGTITMTVQSIGIESKLSGGEYDTTDNIAVATTDFTVTVKDTPIYIVKEDTPIQLDLVPCILPSAGERLTVTITGIDKDWKVTGPGTYNKSTGTWTITLQPGESIAGKGPILQPPKNSDVDMNGLIQTSVVTNVNTGAVKSCSKTIDVIVDAVVDGAVLNCNYSSIIGNENTAIDLPGDLKMVKSDNDGSEEIVTVFVSGLPDGFTINKGTNLGGGQWMFSPDEYLSASIMPSADFSGRFTLSIRVITEEVNLSGVEVDYTDNKILSDSRDFDVTFRPRADLPALTVHAPTINADGSFKLNIDALVTDADRSESLTVEVRGIPKGFTVDGPAGATFNPNSGKWILELPSGQDFHGGPVLKAPMNAHFDVSDLEVRVTSHEDGSPSRTTVGQTLDLGFDVITTGNNSGNTLMGGNDRDLLMGFDGNDVLVGGFGNDTLIGGKGADTLTGGGGSDKFVWQTLDGTVDTVTDFTKGVGGDVLDFSDVLTAYDPVTDAISNFVSVHDNGSGGTIVQISQTGNAADFHTVAVLQGVTGLDVDTLHAQGNLVA